MSDKLKIEQDKKMGTRKPRFDMEEIRQSKKSASEDLIKFGEAEGRRVALKDGSCR